MVFNFFIRGKIFKSFTPIKVRYSFLDGFHISLTVTPDFTDIYWREWYMDVNVKGNIMVRFIKD